MSEEVKILDSGIWDTKREGVFDYELAGGICSLLYLTKTRTVVDFGCGYLGLYVEYFNDRGYNTIGFEGNPAVFEAKAPNIYWIDLTQPVNLNRKFDAVVSLEVGEHIPPDYAAIYIDTLCRHTDKLIILSWALPGQGGVGHVNCQSNEAVEYQMKLRGWELLPHDSNKLRKLAKKPWFQRTVLVFRKKNDSME